MAGARVYIKLSIDLLDKFDRNLILSSSINNIEDEETGFSIRDCILNIVSREKS